MGFVPNCAWLRPTMAAKTTNKTYKNFMIESSGLQSETVGCNKISSAFISKQKVVKIIKIINNYFLRKKLFVRL